MVLLTREHKHAHSSTVPGNLKVGIPADKDNQITNNKGGTLISLSLLPHRTLNAQEKEGIAIKSFDAGNTDMPIQCTFPSSPSLNIELPSYLLEYVYLRTFHIGLLTPVT